jgi:hypothetical protein
MSRDQTSAAVARSAAETGANQPFIQAPGIRRFIGVNIRFSVT